jgi:diketogulonate reductase-like aldo/keto reductase
MSSAVQIATSLSSVITLNDGVIMPLFGLGTYRLSSGGERNAENITSFALKNGYRLLDTAALYGNEQEVGRGIRQSGLQRSEVFVVTKLLTDLHGYKECTDAFNDSLKKLGTEYVDLYLIHSPSGGKLLETYDAMLDLKKKGLIRSVGVSNFGIQHLEGLRKAGKPLPSTNQIELHPMMRKQDIVDYCREHNIAVMGYSPLAKGKKMDDQQLNAVAKKYNKSLAQLMIRWSVQKGYITIPKTSKSERVLENAQVFDWSISDEDMQMMETLPTYGCTWDPTVSAWEGLA